MLSTTSQKLKKDDVADEDYYINKNISLSLQKKQRNKEEEEKNNSQTTVQLFNSEDIEKCTSIILSKSKNETMDENKTLQDNGLKQQHLRRLVTTSPMPNIKQGENFPKQNSCSTSLADQTHLQVTSIDGFFNRKRGRPPKNRFVELYNNIHPKPQAIFTSFKLDKLERKDTETREKEDNIYFYTDLQTLRDFENDDNKSNDYSRQKPIITKLTQRKRSYNTMNNYSPPISIASSETVRTTIREECVSKNIPISNCSNWTKPLFSTALEVHTCVTQESITTNSSPTCVQKLCGTKENVTVIRAAGTFYPENLNDIAKFSDCVLENLHDLPNNKRIPLPFTEEIQYRKNSNGNPIPADLGVKDTNQSKKPYEMSSLSSNFFLPHTFNVFQMKQQFLALYQQMALMQPLFSYLGSQTLANVTEPFTDMSQRCVQQKRNILNMARNQMNQKKNINGNVTDPTYETEQWQVEKQTMRSTTEMLAIRHIRSSETKAATAKSSTIQHSSFPL